MIGMNNQLIAAIMLILGGVIVFTIGYRWNLNKNNIELGSNDSYPKIKIPKHSLFWVAMEYWGVLFLVIGIANMINELLGVNFSDLIFRICSFGFLIMIFVNWRREKKYLKKINDISNQNNGPQKVRNKVGNRLKTNSSIRSEKKVNSNNTTVKEGKEISEKKKIFEDFKKLRNEQKSFKPSNHEDFMPKQRLDKDEA